MLVQVRITTTQHFHIVASLDDDVGIVKAMVEEKTQVPAAMQKLYCLGQDLDDYAVLRETPVLQSSVFYLCIGPWRPTT